MNTDPKKWNPFKFLRGSARKSDADENSETPSANEQWRASWPDIQRLFSREPWRAMEEFLHDPFAGRGALERWFGDFSSSRFQPRIDVVDEGKVLRVTAELPGMAREDLNVSVEDGAIVLRGDKKRMCAAKRTAATGWSAPMEPSCARSRCRITLTPSAPSRSSTMACSH